MSRKAGLFFEDSDFDSGRNLPETQRLEVGRLGEDLSLPEVLLRPLGGNS